MNAETPTARVLEVLRSAQAIDDDTDPQIAVDLVAAARMPEPVPLVAELLDLQGIAPAGHAKPLAHQIVQAVREAAAK